MRKEDATEEDAQQRNMHRILASRQAVITHDAQDVVPVCRLNQVRDNPSYRFGKDEPVQVYYREVAPKKSHWRGGFRFLAVPAHNGIAGNNRDLLKVPLQDIRPVLILADDELLTPEVIPVGDPLSSDVMSIDSDGPHHNLKAPSPPSRDVFQTVSLGSTVVSLIQARLVVFHDQARNVGSSPSAGYFRVWPEPSATQVLSSEQRSHYGSFLQVSGRHFIRTTALGNFIKPGILLDLSIIFG